MKKKRFQLLRFLLLTGMLLSGCQPFGNDLPCPIPEAQMNTPEEGSVPYTIQNNTCTSFCNINISPTRCDDWGWDWIKTVSLRSGDQITVHLPPGRYDVLLEDCSNTEYIIEKQNVDGENTLLLSDTEAETVQDCRASVTVQNLQDEPICYMWIGTENSDRFGRNWLGEEQILPGESSQFYVIPGEYDLKAEGCGFTPMKLELEQRIEEHIIWVVD